MILLAPFIASATLSGAYDVSWLSGIPVCDCPKADDDSVVTDKIDSFDRCITAAYGALPPCPDDVDAVANFSVTQDRANSGITIIRPDTEYAVLTTIKFTDKTTTPTCESVALKSMFNKLTASGDALFFDEAEKSMTITLSPENYDTLSAYPIQAECAPESGSIFSAAEGLVEASFTYQREPPGKITTLAPEAGSSSPSDGTTFNSGFVSLLWASAIYCAV